MASVNFPRYFYQGQRILKKQDKLGEVWLSGVHFAMNPNKLAQNGIVAVVSAANLELSFPSHINHCKFDIKDHQEEEIRHVFYPVIRFIEQERRKGNVLIHCAAGVSRSVSLLIAYMMHKYQKSFENCLSHIVMYRPCAMPNVGFTKQLMEFNSDLGIKDDSKSFS